MASRVRGGGERGAASCGCHLNYVYANLIILQFAQFIVVQLNLKCVFANTVSLLSATAEVEQGTHQKSVT